MGTHNFWGKEKRKAFLNRQPVQSIIAVRGPDTIGVGKNTEVGTTTPGGTAFNFNLWMSFTNTG
tara:strand:+ start:2118 stop:2309 length:192 start_codon:yes stop_codon:yes gene_type:complete